MKIEKLTLEQVKDLCRHSICAQCPLAFHSNITGYTCSLTSTTAPHNWRFDDTKEIKK